jgi:hypothetical protein
MLRVAESKNAEAAKQYFGKGMVARITTWAGRKLPDSGVAKLPSG